MNDNLTNITTKRFGLKMPGGKGRHALPFPIAKHAMALPKHDP